MRKEVYIIGAGPGSIRELTRSAYNFMQECAEVYSFERIALQNRSVRADICICTYLEIIAKVNESKASSIAILVSGDIGFFSMAKTISAKLQSNCLVHSICGISSLQYFCSRIGVSYEDINIVSLHGRNRSILGNIAYHPAVFVLTGGENKAGQICKGICEHLPPDIKVTVGEYLSMENERIVAGTVAEIAQLEWDDLTVMVIENPQYQEKDKALLDEDFIRGEVPMTKEEVRWISVNHLGIKPQDIILDIGAGTGSVSIEMARKAHEGIVYAIEKNEDAIALLNANRAKFGAFNVLPIWGEALEKIQKLPIPDKVFIGGSSGNLEEIILYLYSKNENIRIVINAITLETLTKATAILKEINFTTKINCINSARSKEMGNYNLMIANNPVYIIMGEKNGKQAEQNNDRRNQ